MLEIVFSRLKTWISAYCNEFLQNWWFFVISRNSGGFAYFPHKCDGFLELTCWSLFDLAGLDWWLRGVCFANYRESLDWSDIKLRTLESVQELLRLPLPTNRLSRHMPIPQDIIPLGYWEPSANDIVLISFAHWTHYWLVYVCLVSFRGCRRHQRKRVANKPARDLAYFLVHKR
jgi:hypothetical protein